jgi:integrase
MARTVRDASLQTREARGRLKARGKPYYRAIEEGLHLGYRKPRGRRGSPAVAGKWVVRCYFEKDRTYAVETIAAADDFSDADGVAILNFRQAQDQARERSVQLAREAAGKGPFTVADAMDGYIAWLESEGRSEAALADARYRDKAFIGPKLGDREVSTLTAKDFRHWRDGVMKALPRVRTKPGEKQKHRVVDDDAKEEDREDGQRKRRATVNRTWTTLRAALNKAFENEKVSSDAAWRKVKPYKGTNKARVRYLELKTATHLVNATDADFRQMVQGALLSGGRYGQLAKLVGQDFDRDAGTLRMTTRKGDGSVKVYHVHLTDEGRRFFERACTGKDRTDLIFTKVDGSQWLKSDQARPMLEASERAKINPPVNFHCLRHTYASHSIMNGAPLIVVATNLGHSDTRMVELHYGHLAPSYLASAIRDAAPKFGFKADRKVAHFG